MHFSTRSDFGSAASEYGEALRAARGRETLKELTVSNPTRCGLQFSPDLSMLASAAALQYDPDPLGMGTARDAIGKLYQERYRSAVDPRDVLLTSSTSETYGYLLRLLCEPGDAVLVPSPSYPLLDLLAQLHDVKLITYPLVYHDGWQIDPATLHAAVTPRTRAIVAIHPNNPTGHFCSPADRHELSRCASAHGIPLIVDEVFLDYAVEHGGSSTFAADGSSTEKGGSPGDNPVLTFVLGGLSKLLCMPQMKLAWMVACGPAAERAEAMQRLEVIADTFLSVSTPVQLALPGWLSSCDEVQQQVLARVHTNLAWLDASLPGTVVTRLKVEAGWVVVLRVPASESDTELAIRLLLQHDVALHPGSFYGFPPRGWLVASLLTPTATFQSGMLSVCQAFES